MRRCRFWRSRTILVGAAILFVQPHVWGHDYWLAQEPPAPAVGETVELRLMVGDGLQAELERPLQLEITTRFEWLLASKSVDLLERALDGSQPVFRREVERDGTALVVMDRDFVPTEGTYQSFSEFLEHEGVDDLLSEIADVPNDRPLRRRYARNLKALIRVGDGGSGRAHDRKVGQELEIVLLDDPWSAKPGADLAVRVLFHGEPAKGLPVKSLIDTGEGVAESLARTDEAGVAKFPLEHRGQWVIRATVIRPTDDATLADWDTYYATYSFHLPVVPQR